MTFMIVLFVYVIMQKLGLGHIVDAIIKKFDHRLPFLILAILLATGLFTRRYYIFGEGNKLIRKKQYEAAINELMKETGNEKKMAAVHSQIGYCYFMTGFNRNAINNYLNALAGDEGMIEAYFMLAILYAESKNDKTALEYLEKGKSLQNKRFAFNKLAKFQVNEFEGWVYFLKGDLENAYKCYAKAIPEFDRMLNKMRFIYHEKYASIEYRMGKIQQVEGENESAKKYFKRAIKSSPSSIFAQKAQNELNQLAK
jgi:tetratricopeptide (TPR) repeat protein